MSPSLSDFTFKELFVLKSCIEKKIQDLQDSKSRTQTYLRFDIERGDEPAIEVFNEIITLVNEELEPLQTWLVQIMNAMKIVSDRETIQSN